ncbi:MAG: mannose-1-phosphate guanylyltransferase [Hymenobacteraceae bacterium]|nr:mannose-1-phosphate guanylyltransferase [Hymenobacteraceae bacterium]
MAGGIGSRFWPISRTNHPKQFHDVLGVGRSMLQTTVDRFRTVVPPERVFVVTNRDYAALVREQLPDVPAQNILGEPVGRNTAPCIAWACYRIAQLDPYATVVVTPADHVVLREEAFVAIIEEALTAARARDILLTLGIQPSRPDTGYGYIQFIDGAPGTRIRKVKTFTEKPNLELAQMFVRSGEFLWNSGLFIWNLPTILAGLREHLSEVTEIFDEGAAVWATPAEVPFIETAYSRCRNVSIDYGLMEKADNVYVLPADFGWSDLGTWDSLYSLAEKDPAANVIDADALLYDTTGCVIKVPKDRLVVVQGLENFIIAEHDNVLLICRRDQEQRVKEFVSDAKARKGPSYL